jgi:hypothetical protein
VFPSKKFIPEGSSLNIVAVIKNDGGVTARANVMFRMDGQPFRQEEIELQSGERKNLVVPWVSSGVGSHKVRVTIVDADPHEYDLENNELEAFVDVSEAEKSNEIDINYGYLIIFVLLILVPLTVIFYFMGRSSGVSDGWMDGVKAERARKKRPKVVKKRVKRVKRKVLVKEIPGQEARIVSKDKLLCPSCGEELEHGWSKCAFCSIDLEDWGLRGSGEE